MELIKVNEEPRAEAAMKYRPTVVAAKKGRVHLKLMGTCFQELHEVVGTYSVSLAQLLDNEPWLEYTNAELRACMALLVDVFNYQLEPYITQQPDVVTIKLSRTEAYLFWKVMMADHPPREVFPAFTQLVADLHQILK